MNAPARIFAAKPATRGEEPLLIGLVGPPGGGKTLSALRLARGIQSVRGGDIVLIDTESGRSRKYCSQIPFHHVDFGPPFASNDFFSAIEQQLASKPACIIVDSMSDEHEGEGGYLEYHDAEVGRVRGNEWAAWAKPKARRKRLITGLLQIKVPLIFTFRAREKTAQRENDRGKKEVINIGWQPVAPLEIVHALDLTCILPPKADGVPVWKSDKIGEDFVIKLPNFLQPFIKAGEPLSEDLGAAFARWALGHSGATNPALIGEGPGGGRPGPSPATDEGPDLSTTLELHDKVLTAAAEKGVDELRRVTDALTPEMRATLKAAIVRRHLPRAREVDQGRVG